MYRRAINQDFILAQLRRYLLQKLEYSKEELDERSLLCRVDALRKGHCSGFSVLWLVYMQLGSEDWYGDILHAIASWDGEWRSLERSVLLARRERLSLRVIFEQFIHYLSPHQQPQLIDESLNQNSLLSTPGALVVQDKYGDVHEIKHYQVVKFVMCEKQVFLQLLQYLFDNKPEGLAVNIGARRHSTALYYKDGEFYYYDSNYSVINPVFRGNNLEKLCDDIFQRVSTGNIAQWLHLNFFSLNQEHKFVARLAWLENLREFAETFVAAQGHPGCRVSLPVGQQHLWLSLFSEHVAAILLYSPQSISLDKIDDTLIKLDAFPREVKAKVWQIIGDNIWSFGSEETDTAEKMLRFINLAFLYFWYQDSNDWDKDSNDWDKDSNDWDKDSNEIFDRLKEVFWQRMQRALEERSDDFIVSVTGILLKENGIATRWSLQFLSTNPRFISGSLDFTHFEMANNMLDNLCQHKRIVRDWSIHKAVFGHDTFCDALKGHFLLLLRFPSYRRFAVSILMKLEQLAETADEKLQVNKLWSEFFHKAALLLFAEKDKMEDSFYILISVYPRRREELAKHIIRVLVDCLKHGYEVGAFAVQKYQPIKKMFSEESGKKFSESVAQVMYARLTQAISAGNENNINSALKNIFVFGIDVVSFAAKLHALAMTNNPPARTSSQFAQSITKRLWQYISDSLELEHEKAPPRRSLRL